MKKLLYLLLLAFPSFCVAQETTTLRIDPSAATGGSVSQFYDSVTYIPLETTKASTFGSIQKLQVSEHYFVFYDYSTEGIFIFKKNGKFFSKITSIPGVAKQNRGPFLSGFVLNPYTEDIYIPYFESYDVNENRIAVYKSNGKLSKVIHLDTDLFKSIETSSFAFIDSTTTLFSRITNDNQSNNYFVLLKNFSEVIENKIPVSPNDPFKDTYINYNLLNVNQRNSFWGRNYDYTLFAVLDKKMHSYRFIFPNRLSLDSSIYEDNMAQTKNINEFNEKNSKKITGIASPMKFRNSLLFSTQMGLSYSVFTSFIYNLSSGQLYSFGRITPDSTNGFLPTLYSSPLATDDNYIYFALPAYLMFETMQSTKEKQPHYSPELEKFFREQSRKSNSVIVRMKPKENF